MWIDVPFLLCSGLESPWTGGHQARLQVSLSVPVGRRPRTRTRRAEYILLVLTPYTTLTPYKVPYDPTRYIIQGRG